VSTICGYRVLSELSPGKSWLAEGEAGRKIVLKKLPADCMFNGQLRDSVRDRLARVREIAHMGVASLLGVEKEGETAYLVWEYIEGTNFELNEDTGKKLVRSVEAFHALGLVHGAIHARNVIVREGEVYLIDVSPLLYNEPKVDVQAVGKMLGKEVAPGTTLRELELRDGAATQASGAERDVTIRYGALAAAAVVALVGAAIFFVIWRYA